MELELILSTGSLAVALIVACAQGVMAYCLAKKQVHDSALVDYEFNARSRLYDECEPLLFQAGEACRNLCNRINLIMAFSRKYSVHQHPWLSTDSNLFARGRAKAALDEMSSGYFLFSTVYDLAHPMGYYWLLKKAMSTTDVTVEPLVHLQYVILKRMMLAWTRDYDIAKKKAPVNDPDKRNNLRYVFHPRHNEATDNFCERESPWCFMLCTSRVCSGAIWRSSPQACSHVTARIPPCA
jgi:hypothetical protein